MPPDKYITLNGHLYRLVDDASAELTVSEVVSFTGKGKNTVLKAQNEGLLPFHVPLGCTRPRKSYLQDVIAWNEGRRARA